MSTGLESHSYSLVLLFSGAGAYKDGGITKRHVEETISYEQNKDQSKYTMSPGKFPNPAIHITGEQN